MNLSVSANADTGTEAGQTAITVTATASSFVSGDQFVTLAVTGTGLTAGDYSLTDADSGTTGIQIRILDGQTTGTVTFTIVDDLQVEVTETATLTISSPTSGITLGTTATQNISITDNDTATAATYSTARNGAANSIRVVLNSVGNVAIRSVLGDVLLETRSFASVTDGITINGTDADNDTLTIDFSGGNPFPTGGITFNGGTDGNDTLIITGGTFGTVIYNATAAFNGNLNLAGNIVTFTGLEPVDLTGSTITDLTINVDPDNMIAGTVTTTIAASDGTDTLISFTNGLESTLIRSITGTLTIAGDNVDADIINVSGVGSSFAAALTITGQGGSDTVNLNGDITFALAKSLLVTGESVNTAASADLTTSGAGVITITADDVALDATSTLVSAATVTLTPQTAARAIDLGTNTADSLALTAAELDRITAGTIQIGDANSGAITFSANIDRSSSTNINLTTGVNHNIAFGTFSLNAGASGDVTLTTSGTGAITTGDNTGTDITGDDLSLSAGSNGIGTTTNFLRLAATTLVATTSGNGSINLVEADSVTIAAGGLNAGTGTIALGGGQNITASTVSIQGATLGGSGTVNGPVTMTAAGGSIAPGSSPGQLTVDGNVTFASTGSFNVELNGTTVGTFYDQLRVTGDSRTVTLADAALNVTLGVFTPSVGNSFTIIDNVDDGSTVSGTFFGLPDDSAFTVGTTRFVINYNGGTDSNDVVLTATPTVSVTVTPASVTEDGLTNLVYTFTRTGGSTGSLTVNFSIGGTATNTADYVASGATTFATPTGTVTFADTVTSVDVTINPESDTLVEGNQTVILTVTDAVDDDLDASTTATGTILDADAATIVVSAGQTVTEDGGAQAINVRFISPGNTLENSLTVNVTAAAAGTEAADATFGALGSVTFLPTDASGTDRTVNFTPNSDTLVEGDEAATLTPSGNNLNERVTYTANDVTITDADSATVAFQSDSTTVGEDDAAATNIYIFLTPLFFSNGSKRATSGTAI